VFSFRRQSAPRGAVVNTFRVQRREVSRQAELRPSEGIDRANFWRTKRRSKSRPIKRRCRNPRGQTLCFAFRLYGQVHVEERVHERQQPLSVDMGLNQLDKLVRKAASYLKKAGKPAVQKTLAKAAARQTAAKRA
jgi:hypothetical protein